MSIDRLLPLIERDDCAVLSLLRDLPSGESLPSGDRQILSLTAARAGRADVLRFLFEHHLYSADPDSRGRTLLHEAARSGNADTVFFAMDVLGFDPLEGDAEGTTPFDLAFSAENPSAFRLLAGRLGFSPDRGFRNPVLRGCHPDPSVLRVGEDYYLINSSFTLFPGLPIHHSRDLVHWTEISHAVSCLETSGLKGLPGGYGYWAPDLSFHRGRFWVVATLRRDREPLRLQMITSAPAPEGPWDPPRFLPLDGIDPSLFTDDDGRRYILLNPGAMIAEISDTGELLTGPEMISFGAARIKPEGPHLIKKGRLYYLFLAEGGTGEGHMETVARSRNLHGPYEPCPFNPILGQKNPLSPVRRSGHGKPVHLPDGRWYILYLCGRPVEGKTLMGRETALDPMDWTADGWPMVNRLKGPSCLQKPPFPDSPEQACRQEAWVSPRNDPKAFAEIRDSEIRLTAGEDPAGLAPCSLLLRRQQEAFFTQSVLADLAEAENGTLAALAGYYDERSFCLFGIRKEQQGLTLLVTEQIGPCRTTKELARLEGTSALLSVRGTGLNRRLSLMENGVETAGITIRTEYLCDEGLADGKRFTGAMIGLAAAGSGLVRFLNPSLRQTSRPAPPRPPVSPDRPGASPYSKE